MNPEKLESYKTQKNSMYQCEDILYKLNFSHSKYNFVLNLLQMYENERRPNASGNFQVFNI